MLFQPGLQGGRLRAGGAGRAYVWHGWPLTAKPVPRRPVALPTSVRTLSTGAPPFTHPGKRRFVWLSSALAIAFSASFLASQLPFLHLEAPSVGEPGPGSFRLDPSTSQPFPLSLPQPLTPIPSSCKNLQLVGLGVRTVSFLSIKVYVAGLYIDANALNKLSSIEGWNGFQKSWMMDSKEEHSGEKLVASLLDSGATWVIRIVPVRSTDFGHLRDGFTRAIQGRAKLARKQSQLSESADESLSHSLQALKDAFPRASLPKGQALDLIFTPSNAGTGLDLTLEEGGKVLGKIQSPSGPTESKFSVARQLMLAYLADKDEISKAFKDSVADGFQHAVQQSDTHT